MAKVTVNSLPITKARKRISAILDAAEHHGEVTVLTRHKTEVAAVIPWGKQSSFELRLKKRPSTARKKNWLHIDEVG